SSPPQPLTINGANIPCSLEYTPICGTNGVTYRNKCHFCNAVALLNQSRAASLRVSLEIPNIDCSQQKGSNLLCTSNYDPLCGSDGRTYGNKCHFCNAVSTSRGSLFLRHRGAC
uniref:Ovomucoid n=1 Tax=Calidris pygmaea TaxID=425635 RepID=A0A8C3KDX6_9CHAR